MIRTVEIAHGALRAQFLDLGASLRSLTVPDLRGEPGNVVLGYRDPEDYRIGTSFLGAAVGRYANRIGGARFHLDGREYRLLANDGAHSLHSGPLGFDRRSWTIAAHDARSVRFALRSPDGESGFPGDLHVTLTYRMETDGLAIAFEAIADAPTVVNLTHHAYFNLAGEATGQVTGQWLQVAASRYTPVEALIPTGALAPVAGTPFDFRSPRPIGGGYDHNLVLDSPAGRIRRIATAWDPGSGRVLEVHSDQPGVQFYTGDHLAGGPPGTSGHAYAAREGFCLEPQKFPDSPNKPAFPSARLDPGERYVHDMAFRFRTAAGVAEAFSE